MTNYDDTAQTEMQLWQNQMLEQSSRVNRAANYVQQKINHLIPEKVHVAVTATIKHMVRGVLFGAKVTTREPVREGSLESREALILERIAFYKKAAAAEGGVAGAGGLMLGLADFPVLLGLKMKMLFDIAAMYGYDVTDYRERLYLLHIFQLAFSSQEHRKKVYLDMSNWNEHKLTLPDDVEQFDWRSFQQQYRDYIDLAKLAQLIPVIGAPVGVYVNYRLIKKLGVTAMNAYRMRWNASVLTLEM
jgi:hypothetical protein